MNNTQMLSAISDMLDEKISNVMDEKLQLAENRISDRIGEKMSKMVDEKLQSFRKDFSLEMSDMMDKKIKPLAELQHNTTLMLENDVLPRLQNIESCYTSTYRRYVNNAEKIEAMESDIQLLKEVVREHSEQLKKIS